MRVENNTDHMITLPYPILGVEQMEPGESLEMNAPDFLVALDEELDVHES